MENIYTARMESIVEDNSLEAVTQQFVEQHSKIESEHLDINDKDIKRLTISGSLIEKEINDDMENKRQSLFHLFRCVCWSCSNVYYSLQCQFLLVACVSQLKVGSLKFGSS